MPADCETYLLEYSIATFKISFNFDAMLATKREL